MKQHQSSGRLAAMGAAIGVAVLGLAGQAHAGAIFSATSAVINSGGPGLGDIAHTYNRSGLLSDYVANVTDFDTYISSNPLHRTNFNPGEWFSSGGTTNAIVTYNFGSVRTFNKMALWNEETSGIGLLDLLISSDGVNFSNLALGLTPTDNPSGASYAADVFSFGIVSAQYLRMNMSRCPQSRAAFQACAIGEVAFRETAAEGTVPEPSSLALVGLSLVGAGLARRRAFKA